jgi:hypothetical protein
LGSGLGGLGGSRLSGGLSDFGGFGTRGARSPAPAAKPEPEHQTRAVPNYQNFASLRRIALATGGFSIELTPNRKVPDIFKTEMNEVRIGRVTFEDAYPLVAGARIYNVVNGEGAVCEATVTWDDIRNNLLNDADSVYNYLF